jgi:hypothetical protein
MIGRFADPAIALGRFFVFGNSAHSYVDFNYGALTGSFALSNGGDEIVVVDTLSGSVLARRAYDDGDREGDGLANVLDSMSNAVDGVTQYINYRAETAQHDTLPSADIGSPGIAGSTEDVIAAIPGPAALALALVLVGAALSRLALRLDSAFATKPGRSRLP